MATLHFLQALKRLLRRAPAPEPTFLGTLHQAAGGGIDDGVSYGMPPLLPRLLREALESTGKLDAYLAEAGNAVFRHPFDAPYATDVPFGPVTEDPLREWNWATREYVLSNTHAAYQRNPLANRGLKYLAAFVVGPGFNVSFKHPAVDALLTAFIDHPDNSIRKYERQAPIDLCVDGELMLRCFTDGGRTVAVPLRPWECHSIRTEKGFFRRPTSYRFQRYLTEGDAPDGTQSTETEDVPAAEMQHVAINQHGYELRGRPELYAILPWLRAYKDWLENRARQNHWRNALLWRVKVKNATAAVLAAVAARWRKPPSPGSVAVESDNVDVEALTNAVGASDAGEDGRQIKLMNAVGLGLPEYFLSDGANANLASTTSQQLPALMTFSDFQRILIEELWYPLFTRVIANAVDAGQLDERLQEHDAEGDPMTDDEKDPRTGEVIASVPRMIDAADAFDVSYAPLDGANQLTIAQALQIAAANGWVDDETATTEMGFDYAIVQKRLKRQRESQRDDMANGRVPTPPGFAPPGMDGAADDETDDEQPDETPEPEAAA